MRVILVAGRGCSPVNFTLGLNRRHVIGIDEDGLQRYPNCRAVPAACYDYAPHNAPFLRKPLGNRFSYLSRLVHIIVPNDHYLHDRGM